MCFDKHKWFSWACSILFLISALLYIALGFVFIKDEVSKFKSLADNGSSTSNEQNVVRDVNVQQNINEKNKV